MLLQLGHNIQATYLVVLEPKQGLHLVFRQHLKMSALQILCVLVVATTLISQYEAKLNYTMKELDVSLLQVNFIFNFKA